MSLSHDSYTFESLTDHGDIVAQTPKELPIVRGQFFGVKGEGALIGETYGRDVECRAHLFGYNSVALLKAAIGRIRDRQGKLTGTLTVTGNLAQVHQEMTFVEVIEPPPGARYDGSGVNGWHQEIILRWRQRK